MASELARTMLEGADLAEMAFEAYVDAFGVEAEWYQRTDRIPNSGGEVSEASARSDPVDANWQDDLSNPSVYYPNGKVVVAKDIPSNIQGENFGQQLTGTSTGYCLRSQAVEAGDILVMDGRRYAVKGSRIPTPPIYRELTLERS